MRSRAILLQRCIRQGWSTRPGIFWIFKVSFRFEIFRLYFMKNYCWLIARFRKFFYWKFPPKCGFIYNDRFDLINIITSKVFGMKLGWCRGKCILVDINSFVSGCIKVARRFVIHIRFYFLRKELIYLSWKIIDLGDILLKIYYAKDKKNIILFFHTINFTKIIFKHMNIFFIESCRIMY